MSKQELKQKGFTIIEVVLVLAIAALIFLMVFIALPALQRNQRDTQRRTDAGAFVSQIQSYATNSKGKIPDTDVKLDAFKAGYLKWTADIATSEFNDPKTGAPYVITYATGTPTVDGTIFYSAGAICGDGGAITAPATASPRIGAVAIKLEGSGVFCQETKS